MIGDTEGGPMTAESPEIPIETMDIETLTDQATSIEVVIGIMITIATTIGTVIATEIVIAMTNIVRKKIDIVGKTTGGRERTLMATEKGRHGATIRTREPQKSIQRVETVAMRNAQIQMASQTYNP